MRILPKNPSHDEGNGRENIVHGNSKGCCGVLHSQKIQILVNNRPAMRK